MRVTSASERAIRQRLRGIFPILSSSSVESSVAPVGQDASPSGDAAIDLSQAANTFWELRLLSKNDPEKFSSLMDGIAYQMEKVAKSSVDRKRSIILEEIAGGFRRGRKTGDLSQLCALVVRQAGMHSG